MECHQCALSLDRNSGLQMALVAVLLSCCFFSHSKVNSPCSRHKKNLPPEFLPVPDKLFWVLGQVLENLSLLTAAALKDICFNCCRMLQQKPFQIPILDMLCSVSEFQAFEFQLLISSFLLRKAPYHHTFKVLLRYIQIKLQNS